MSSSAPRDQSRLRLRLKPIAEAAVRAGHPWVFADSVRAVNRPGLAGELGVIYDRKDHFLAVGLFDPRSPIRLRVLHCGKPVAIDSSWWRQHLRAAVQRREGLFDPETDGYRVIHGENDSWPGLVLDRYGSVYALKIYTAAWLPRLNELVPLFAQELGLSHLVLRISRNIAEAATEHSLSDGQLLQGPPLESIPIFRENGLRFEADVVHGQKTGFFLDQRENRQRVELLASGRAMLNLFSFSGGFAAYAARGGAGSVTEVDISPHALASGARNFALNQSALKACPRHTIQADVFEWLESDGGQKFDLVVMDPPSMARREAQKTAAIRAYQRLVKGSVDRLRSGGVLVAASCSAHVSVDEFYAAVWRGLSAAQRKGTELWRSEHPADHPSVFKEAHYLKALTLQLD